MSAGAVDGFVRDAEQFDDLTMMCIEYKKILHNEKKPGLTDILSIRVFVIPIAVV